MASSATPKRKAPGLKKTGVRLLAILVFFMGLNLWMDANDFSLFGFGGGSGGGLDGYLHGGTSAPTAPPTYPNGSTTSPSSTTDQRVQYYTQALSTGKGRALKSDGYQPVAVLQQTSKNGTLSKGVDGFTSRQGTYVVFRKDAQLKPGPNDQDGNAIMVDPDRVVMVNTNTSAAENGKLVAYQQDFSDSRGTLCLATEKFDLADQANWHEINVWLHGKMFTTQVWNITNTDVKIIPPGITLNCFTYNPDEQEMPQN